MNLYHFQMEDQGPIQIDENATEGQQEDKSEEYTDFDQATEGRKKQKTDTDTEYSMPVSTSNANVEQNEAQEHLEEVKSQIVEAEASGHIKELIEEQSLK